MLLTMQNFINLMLQKQRKNLKPQLIHKQKLKHHNKQRKLVNQMLKLRRLTQKQMLILTKHNLIL